MVKLLFLCRRRADLTHERYAELLLGGHVPLALRHHPTLRRYVVNVVEEALAGAPPLDSIGALSFDTLADYRERLYDSPEGERAIQRDVAGFLGGADAYATREHVVRAPGRPPRPAAKKLVACIVRAPALARDAFVREWLERRVPALLRAPGVEAYVANLVEQRLAAAAPAYDGMAEIHVEGTAADGALRESLEGVGLAHVYRVAEHVARG